MTTLFLISILVLGFLMVFNLWVKSLLISVACIVLTMFVLFSLPEPVVAVDYYPLLAGYLVLFAEVVFILTRVERF